MTWYADWCSFVSFARFLAAAFADTDVVIGDEARPAVLVLVQVQTRALVVDDDGIALIRAQLHQVARHVIIGRSIAVGTQADQRFGAQVIEPPTRSMRGVSKGFQFPAPGEEQISFDEIGQSKVWFGAEQGFDLSERLIEMVALDLLKYLAEQVVGTLFSLGRRKEENAGEAQCPGE